MQGSVVIGIAGGSGSGKSTLAQAIRGRLGCPATTIGFDDYYADQHHLPPERRVHVNYDHPNSLDALRLASDLGALRQGAAVESPVYDFTTHTRTDLTTVVLPQPVVLVDGILLLHYAEIRAQLDVSVYLSAPEPVRFARRLARDVEERGRTPASVHAQFHDTVAPMHDTFVQPSAFHADVVISGQSEITEGAGAVMALLPRGLGTEALV